MLFNPQTETFDDLDAKSREIMRETVAFFERKGLARVKEEYHDAIWYSDLIAFFKEHEVFSALLTPSGYGEDKAACRWDTNRNSAMSEILGFYGINYWYVWQVTILGLGPIWMGDNEEVKRKTAGLLRDGGIFAFGLSEKEHGADLYSSSMELVDDGEGGYLARGSKYYIGNGNEAALVSVFAKKADTDEYVWFAVDSQHDNYELVKNIVPWSSYVAEFKLNDYPIAEGDILTVGPKAWDSALNTVNVGKYNLGWGAVGIATHAFFEALDHAAGRNLYNMYVTEFTHVRQLFADAYARLAAMRLFSRRSIDYMRSASGEDRRYLLYNALEKMKVTTQGEQVVDLLWDIIAAKGFEKDTYFEMAAMEIRALPKLEGTVHVNMALVVKFMVSFLFKPVEMPEVARRDDTANDDFLFDQPPSRGLAKVAFHDYRKAYDSVDIPNVNRFKGQIDAFKALLAKAAPTPEQSRDVGLVLTIGEMFTLIAYGQLILEEAQLQPVSEALLDHIFDVMVRDMSRHALDLYCKPGITGQQKECAQAVIMAPVEDGPRFDKVWEEVYANRGVYTATE